MHGKAYHLLTVLYIWCIFHDLAQILLHLYAFIRASRVPLQIFSCIHVDGTQTAIAWSFLWSIQSYTKIDSSGQSDQRIQSEILSDKKSQHN